MLRLSSASHLDRRQISLSHSVVDDLILINIQTRFQFPAYNCRGDLDKNSITLPRQVPDALPWTAAADLGSQSSIRLVTRNGRTPRSLSSLEVGALSNASLPTGSGSGASHRLVSPASRTKQINILIPPTLLASLMTVGRTSSYGATIFSHLLHRTSPLPTI